MTPEQIAAQVLDRLAFREVWNWSWSGAGPCGLLGSLTDEIDPLLVEIRTRTGPHVDRDELLQEFEDRALEIDTECARDARAAVSGFARAAQELRYGRGWRNVPRGRCEVCGSNHRRPVSVKQEVIQ